LKVQSITQLLSKMQVSCQCGAIAFKTPTPSPIKVYHCHCSQCRKQSASAYGTSAIFPAAGLFLVSGALASQLESGALKAWTRPTASGNTLDCYFCTTCGVRIMHKAREKDTVSIKGGCIDALVWDGACHIWCANAVVSIPDGADKWEGEPDD
jgi:hypothetical protein